MAKQSTGRFDDENTMLRADDVRHIAELSLGLRNLSFALTEFVAGGRDADLRSQDGALFSLFRQVTNLSCRLEDLSRGLEGGGSAVAAMPAPAGLRRAVSGSR